MSEPTIGEAWRALGERTGGQALCELKPLSQSEYPFELRFRGDILGAPVQGEGRFSTWEGGDCRFWAPSSMPKEFFLRVQPWAYRDLFGRLFGAQDIKTGDDDFDKQFTVKSNSEEMARLFLPQEVRSLIAGASAKSYGVEGGLVVAHSDLNHLEELPEGLSAAVEAIALLSKQGAFAVRAWAELAQSLGGELSFRERLSLQGETKVEAEVRGVRLRIELQQKKSGLFSAPRILTRLVAQRTSAQGGLFIVARERPKQTKRLVLVEEVEPELKSEYQVYAQEKAQLLSVFDVVKQDRLIALAPESLVAEEREMTLWLRGIQTNVEKLHEAASLLADLCLGATSQPYR